MGQVDFNAEFFLEIFVLDETFGSFLFPEGKGDF